MSDSLHKSMIANESIPAYTVVAINASATADGHRCELADTSTSVIIGIAQDDYSTNDSADIIVGGISRAKCSASVSAGSVLAFATATGEVVEVANNTATAIRKTI